ncbi:MAG: hypothetical protein ACQGQP_06335 [Desulfovibrio sp.]|nr:hypothetical protein [Mailhella sp.]
MRLCFLTMLLAAALCGCAGGSFDSDSVKVSGDMITAVGIGHGVRGAQSARVGVDF